MSRYVDLDERVTAQFYDEECEEWTMQTCTIADVLDSVCDEYTVLPPAQPEIVTCKDCRWRKDQSGSTAWLPCRAIVTPSDFYCGRAERRTDG